MREWRMTCSGLARRDSTRHEGANPACVDLIPSRLGCWWGSEDSLAERWYLAEKAKRDFLVAQQAGKEEG